MTMEIDGAAVLAALAKDPTAFAMTRQQVDAVAHFAISLKLKEKKLSIGDLRALAAAIGPGSFKTVIGNLPAKEAKTVAKLDEKNPDYKSADEHWYRARVIALGLGQADLAAPQKNAKAPQPARAEAPKAAKASKIGTIMGSEALAAGIEQKKRGGSKKSKSK